MSVTKKDVLHVAGLARLGLTDERAEALTRDMNTILEHMDVLAKVDTSSVANLAIDVTGMRLREDDGAPPPAPLAAPPAKFAPEFREGFFIVPRLATHEDTESA